MPEPCPSQAWDSRDRFHLFFSPEILPRQPATDPQEQQLLPTATSHSLPGTQSIYCPCLSFIKYFALFTKARGSEGISEIFH